MDGESACGRVECLIKTTYNTTSIMIKKPSLILLYIFSIFNSCQKKSEQNKSSENVIVFKDKLGHSLSKNDLQNTTGKVNYEIMDNQNTNATADQLHKEARQLGQSGKYDLAITKLQEAIKIQPDWAYPTYDLAFTYLLKGDFESALKFYKRTDELAPKGFFTTKAALYTLEGEQSGKFPKGLYLAYLQIEWTDNKEQKLEIAKTLTDKVPDFAPAWKELSNLLNGNAERLKTIEQGLSKNPDADTAGMLKINKAILLNNVGKGEKAKNLLGNLIFSADATTATIEMAKFTLKSIS
ncbi:tetratricopeptide repeat protein [Chryseobacterium sp. sg2396]|uniref:tetratricopeptide repeat protein n=1 Tax=Chryseobacterium sp. sg2396 TaxID=3276280 RepID=UPI0036704135